MPGNCGVMVQRWMPQSRYIIFICDFLEGGLNTFIGQIYLIITHILGVILIKNTNLARK
jgi:hypothetical protein